MRSEPKPLAAASETAAKLKADRALLVRWRDGDRQAGETLLLRHKQFVHGVAVRCGVHGEDAIVEVFQDVVLAAVRELPSLPERIETSFAGWLAWQVRDVLSRRRRAERPTAPMDAEPAAPRSTGSGAPGDFAIREAVERCAEALPPREREVFALRFVAGLEIAEAASALSLAPNAVSQAVFRLSRRLRACLRQAGFGDE